MLFKYAQKMGLCFLMGAYGLPCLADQVIQDDSVIKGSLGVGLDASNGENFGYDTIRLKENNLRINFVDTSSSSSFPGNDWQIVINDSSNGGSNYFAIEDSDGQTTPFKVMAGAPTGSIHVNSSGHVGFGTVSPALKLHVKVGDTPALRLEQDQSSGFSAQTWDVGGNEANFFIRDSNNAKIPFKINPGAPNNTLVLAADGRVGLGKNLPTAALDVVGDGVFSGNVSGAAGTFTGITFNEDGSIVSATGATLSIGGSWIDASSAELKQDISDLSEAEALRALQAMRPVHFAYKTDPQERKLGFIAEEVPDLVATNDRKGLSPMDIVGVLTRVAQAQEARIKRQDSELDHLISRIEDLEKQLNDQ